MNKYKYFFFCCGLVLFGSEIWKQWCLTFYIGHGSYNWWYFPFQLCSIPMYLCLIVPWIHSQKYQNTIFTFLMDYGLLGGIFAFFDTSGMHYPFFPLTIHSFAWHILLIVLGLTAGLSKIADYSKKGWIRTTLFYLYCCCLATCFNVLFHSLGTINMFYISPYYPMSQKVFRTIAQFTGNMASILIYILTTILGSALFHWLWYQKNRQIPVS